jgi:hypothetical protein
MKKTTISKPLGTLLLLKIRNNNLIDSIRIKFPLSINRKKIFKIKLSSFK